MLEAVDYAAQVVLRLFAIMFLVGCMGVVAAAAYVAWRERPWRDELEE